MMCLNTECVYHYIIESNITILIPNIYIFLFIKVKAHGFNTYSIVKTKTFTNSKYKLPENPMKVFFCM